MHHLDRAGIEQLDAEVPVGHAVETVARHVVKAELLGLKKPVGVIRRTGERAAADGRDVHALDRIAQAVNVTQEHHGIGHQVVAEGDGLRALQVRVAGQNVALVRPGLLDERREHVLCERNDLARFVAQVHAQVERDLIVARAGGVQLLAEVADARGEHLLDEHMDVLARGVERERAAVEIVEDALQRVDDGIGVRLGENVLRAEHRRVRHAARDVLAVHPAVEADGGVEIVRDRIGHAGRAARPHFCHGDGLPSSVVPAPGGPARGENHFYIFIVPLTCSCRQPLPARRSADRRAG